MSADNKKSVMPKLHEWETVEAKSETIRMRVPGGWVYSIGPETSQAAAFVPEPEPNGVSDHIIAKLGEAARLLGPIANDVLGMPAAVKADWQARARAFLASLPGEVCR